MKKDLSKIFILSNYQGINSVWKILVDKCIHILSPWHWRHCSQFCYTQKCRWISKSHRSKVVLLVFCWIWPIQLCVFDRKCSSKAITCTHCINNFMLLKNFLIWWWTALHVQCWWNETWSFAPFFEKNFQVWILWNQFVSDLIDDIVKIDGRVKSGQLSFVWWDVIKVLK